MLENKKTSKQKQTIIILLSQQKSPVRIDPNRFFLLICDRFYLYNIQGNTGQAIRRNALTRTIFSAISVS